VSIVNPSVLGKRLPRTVFRRVEKAVLRILVSWGANVSGLVQKIRIQKIVTSAVPSVGLVNKAVKIQNQVKHS